MIKVKIESGRYTVTPVYQWDKNHTLEIRGLSLPSVPEIHFANDIMDQTIARKPIMDNSGVITVEVPNSLFHRSLDINVYICIYEKLTRKTLYTLVIPVAPRVMPSNYQIADDGTEIWVGNLQEKTATNNGTITPDPGYDGLSKVVVNLPDPVLQEKNVTQNGTVTADKGYDGLSKVTVNVPERVIKLQAKTVDPSENEQSVKADSEYDGLDEVIVNPAKLQEITVSPNENSQSINPDNGFYGIKKVTVDPVLLQEKTVDPSNVKQEITQDDNYHGLSKVIVNPVVLQEKTVQPSDVVQEIVPDSGFYGLSKVLVEASAGGEEIPSVEGVSF